MSAKTFHPGKLSLYLTLSVADLLLTYHLLQQSGGSVYEGNPIANAWLSAYGWAGLILFKAMAVLIAGGAAAFISVYQPQRGGYVLKFACCALALVVLYSFSLVRSLGAETGQPDARALSVEKQIAVNYEYDKLIEHLRDELIAGRCTLVAAVSRLSTAEKAQSPTYLRHLHERHPGCSDSDCLALELVQSVLPLLRDQPAKKELFARGLAEIRDPHSTRLVSAAGTLTK
jgi:hypothetical protein